MKIHRSRVLPGTPSTKFPKNEAPVVLPITIKLIVGLWVAKAALAAKILDYGHDRGEKSGHEED